MGPQRVKRIDLDLVYEIEDLIRESGSLVQDSCLTIYADSQPNKIQDLLEKIQHESHHHTELPLTSQEIAVLNI